MSKNTMEIIPSKKQSGTLYEMELKFKISIELKEINDIMSNFGFDEKAGLKDVIELTMHQIVPFIPDEEIIQKYTEMIKENYLKNNKEFSCSSCKFCGYNYLYAVKAKTKN